MIVRFGNEKYSCKSGIEFLAVFLGIALSLWVDDFREEKELSNRIIDDYQNIYSEVKSNILIIEEVIQLNKDINVSEEKILEILNGKMPYDQDSIINLLANLNSLTFLVKHQPIEHLYLVEIQFIKR